MTLSHRTFFFSSLVLFLCIAAWAWFQLQMRMPPDATWLHLSAEKILEGYSMREAFYDTNPPMSYLVYLPSAFMSLVMGLSDYVAITLYGLMLIFLSVLSVGYSLSPWTKNNPVFFWAVLSAYTAAVSVFMNQYFAEKEHLILLGLTPFLLTQINLTYRRNGLNKKQLLILILATPFILIKPHFGLLPTVLLAHRFIRERRLSIVTDPDFLALAIGVILYIAAVFVRFPDFIEEVLPASLDLYVFQNFYDLQSAYVTKDSIALFVLIFFCALTAYFRKPAGTHKNFSLFFAGMAFLAGIAFWTQNKGFMLHAMPALGFLAVSALLTASLYLPLSKKESVFENAVLIITSFITLAVFSWPEKYDQQTHQAYETYEFVHTIRNTAGTDAYFIEAYATNIPFKLHHYTKATHASRFPLMWFLPALNKMPPQKRKEYRDRFGTYIAEDFSIYKPRFAAVLDPEKYDDTLLENLADHPDFQTQWSHYKLESRHELPMDDYHKSLLKTDTQYLTYDVYVRDAD